MNWKIISCSVAILLFYFIISIIAFDLSGDITNCPKGLEADTKKACCKKLRRKARNQAPYVCCEYPQYVIWTWQYNLCLEQCDIPIYYDSELFGEHRCCHYTCCLVYLRIIGPTPHIDGIWDEGLRYSFFISTENNTKWLDVINTAVDMCNTQFRTDIPPVASGNDTTSPEYKTTLKNYEDYWECFETIPKYLQQIVDCIYNRNFLMCPTYSDETKWCPEWKTYTQDCFIDVNE